KDCLVAGLEPGQSAKKDYVFLPSDTWAELVPAGHRLRNAMMLSLRKYGGVQPTYDLSVPGNVTYVANGMVSHNTIGLMMDCDTTGIEPDLALVKFKK